MRLSGTAEYLSTLIAGAKWHSWLTVSQSRLTRETAKLAEGHSAVCLFVNDDADATARSTNTLYCA